MARGTNDQVSVVLGMNATKIQADLVQRGLQSRVRGIMAIYGIEREEAEKVLFEIYKENGDFGTAPKIPFPPESSN